MTLPETGRRNRKQIQAGSDATQKSDNSGILKYRVGQIISVAIGSRHSPSVLPVALQVRGVV